MTGFEFHFLRPLWLLVLLPLALVLWRLLRSNGDADVWRGVVDAHLLPGLLTDGGGNARRRPLVMLGLGWLLIALALAGPVWERLPEPLYQARQFRVVVLDLSPSMNATDLAPSRLARARYEVLDLLRQSDEGQTALLAFGAEPFVVSPLTSDVETIAAQVPSLDTSLLPVSGARRTDWALDQAGELLQQAGATDGDVILVSDGLGPVDAAKAAAGRLKSSGFRVSVLGVGTTGGAPVPLADGGYLKDGAGAISMPKLDVTGLRELADVGGGLFVGAEFGDHDIAALKSSTATAAAEETEEKQTQTDRWREEGPWLLLVLLPLGALAFRRGWLSPLVVLVFLVPPPEAHALSWEELWLRPDQRATRLLEKGSPEEAAQVFQRPEWRAAAQYQANDYEQALQSLQGLGGPDAGYNLGNALARLGRLDEAVAAYDRSLGLVPGDADAQHNRQLVQDLIDQQKQQQDQQDQQDQQGQQEQDQEQDGEQQAQQSQSGGQGSQQEQSDAQQADASGSQGQQEQEPQNNGQDSQDGEQGAQQADAQGASESQDNEGKAQDPQQLGEQGSGEQTQQAQQAEGRAPQGAGEQPQQSEEQMAGQEPKQAGEQEAGEGQQQTPTAGGQDAETGQQEQQSAKSQGPEVESQGKQAGETGSDDEGRQADAQQDPGDTTDNGLPRQQTPGQTGDAPGLADLLGDDPAGTRGNQAADSTSGLDLEDQQAVEQMLRRVEDDPAGLLRQRFLLQHLRRTGQLP